MGMFSSVKLTVSSYTKLVACTFSGSRSLFKWEWSDWSRVLRRVCKKLGSEPRFWLVRSRARQHFVSSFVGFLPKMWSCHWCIMTHEGLPFPMSFHTHTHNVLLEWLNTRSLGRNGSGNALELEVPHKMSKETTDSITHTVTRYQPCAFKSFSADARSRTQGSWRGWGTKGQLPWAQGEGATDMGAHFIAYTGWGGRWDDLVLCPAKTVSIPVHVL